MSHKLNISVLVAAKEQYYNQLKRHLVPLLYEGFVSIYEDAKEKQDNQKTYEYIPQFMLFLKEIPKWNQSILDSESKRIEGRISNKSSFLMDMVTAIFVSSVQILASVRLGGSHKNIKVKIPTSEILIHSIYTNAAYKFYKEPKLFLNHKEKESYDKITFLLRESVEDTIESMMPLQNILEEYLSNVFDQHVTEVPKEDEPEDEPEDFDRQLSADEMALDDLSTDPPSRPHSPNLMSMDSFSPVDKNAPPISIFDDKDIDKQFDNDEKDPFKDDPFKVDPFKDDPFKNAIKQDDPFEDDPFKDTTIQDNSFTFKEDKSDDLFEFEDNKKESSGGFSDFLFGSSSKEETKDEIKNKETIPEFKIREDDDESIFKKNESSFDNTTDNNPITVGPDIKLDDLEFTNTPTEDNTGGGDIDFTDTDNLFDDDIFKVSGGSGGGSGDTFF